MRNYTVFGCQLHSRLLALSAAKQWNSAIEFHECLAKQIGHQRFVSTPQWFDKPNTCKLALCMHVETMIGVAIASCCACWAGSFCSWAGFWRHALLQPSGFAGTSTAFFACFGINQHVIQSARAVVPLVASRADDIYQPAPLISAAAALRNFDWARFGLSSADLLAIQCCCSSLGGRDNLQLTTSALKSQCEPRQLREHGGAQHLHLWPRWRMPLLSRVATAKAGTRRRRQHLGRPEDDVRAVLFAEDICCSDGPKVRADFCMSMHCIPHQKSCTVRSVSM